MPRPAPTRARVGGLVGAGAVAIVIGLLAGFPLLLAGLGVLELVASVRGAWDPTWNDGDLGLALLAAVGLLVLLAIAAALGWMFAGVARLPRGQVVWATVGGTVLVAAAVVAVVVR